VDAVRRTIEGLTVEKVRAWKAAADTLAEPLSGEHQTQHWIRMAGRLRRAPRSRSVRPKEAPRREVARRLILLTNEYPLDRGDATFVGNEIDALAAAYDEVVVFNFPSVGEWRMRCAPDNVVYGGSLREGDRSEIVRRLLRPAALARLARIVWTEWRHRRIGRRVKPVAIVAAAAVSRAGHPRLRRLLRERKVRTDVYAFWGMGAGMALAALPPVNGRTILRLHRYDLYEEVLGWLPLRATMLTRPDLILPISDDGARYLRERYPWSDLAPIKVARLGTLDRGVGPRPDGSSGLTVVSCSAITEVKRVDLLARTMHVLAQRRRVRWVHFGDGPLAGSVAELVRELTESAEGRLSVDLRGQTANDRILEFYLSEPVDVFVNVSSSEGVPVSIMEAMSTGIPVVATRVGGVAEIVSEQLGSGETISPDPRPEEVAAAIERVAADAALDPRAVWERLSDAKTNAAELIEELRA